MTELDLFEAAFGALAGVLLSGIVFLVCDHLRYKRWLRDNKDRLGL